MALPVEDKERHLLPRWHDSSRAAARNEIRSLIGPHSSHAGTTNTLLSEKAAAWEQHRTVSYATDLVGTALLTKPVSEAIDAAHFLLGSPDSSATARVLARSLVDPEHPVLYHDQEGGEDSSAGRRHLEAHFHRGRIRFIRRRLAEGPRNPLGWADLAYEYTALGLSDKAGAAMLVALDLAPESRFVLRSAVRLYANAGDSGRAIAIIRAAAITPFDPWLIAAEIAASSAGGRTPRFAKVGRRMMQADTHSPLHLSELAGALGTLEHSAGDVRGAKRLFKLSLVDPTENAVAQAEWAARRLRLFTLPPEVLKAPGNFEARARDRLKDGRFRDGLDEAWNWLEDESFSRDAAAFGSYIAAVGLRDYEQSIAAAKAGLLSNPDDWLLTNNLVFALATSGRVAEAEQEFSRIRPSPSDEGAQAIYSATAGLLSFRRGEASAGRSAYAKAVQYFARAKMVHPTAVACVFWAREELLAGEVAAADKILSEAGKAISRLNAPEIQQWSRDLRQAIEAQERPPA